MDDEERIMGVGARVPGVNRAALQPDRVSLSQPLHYRWANVLAAAIEIPGQRRRRAKMEDRADSYVMIALEQTEVQL